MMNEATDPKHEDEAAEERDRNRAAVIIEAAVDGTVAALQVARPELAAVFAALGAPAKAALTRLVRLTNAKREERASYTLASGIALANTSVDDFERRCEEDPDLLQLCTKVVLAAQDAVFQGKLDGLARSLASALEDGAKVDEEILFTSVLAQLEAPHIRLLAHIGRNPADTPLNRDNDPTDFPTFAYNSIQLAMLDPNLEPVLAPLLGTLSASGLITRGEPPGMMMGSLKPEQVPYAISDFGKRMIARVRGIADDKS
jgi:hypothetical protein